MQLKDLILKDMPSNLDDLGKARYVYIMLALYFSFSTKFNNTTTDEFTKMYNQKIDFDNIVYNQINCRHWAQIYSYLLNALGIENIIVNEGHSYVAFKYNEEYLVADPTYDTYSDLARIRYGEKTIRFGKGITQDFENHPSNVVINDEEMIEMLDNIDDQIPIYKYKKQLLDTQKLRIKEIVKLDLPKSEKLDLVFRVVGKLKDGFYEAKAFTHNLLSLTKIEDLHAVELKRTNKNMEVDILACIWTNQNGEYHYYLLAPNLEVKKVSVQEVIDLAILGYGLDDKSIPGIDYPRNFNVGNVDRLKMKYRVFKNKVPIYLQPYNKEQIGQVMGH